MILGEFIESFRLEEISSGSSSSPPYYGSTDFIILKAALIDGCQVWLMFHAFKTGVPTPGGI